MKSRYVRSFASADEVMELELLRSSVITIGGLTVSYDIHQPGWRWSTHVKPIVRTESCQSRHLGMLIRGTIHAVFDDGTEAHAGPLDLIDWPAGHDAWVVGDEPVEMIGWTGGKTWLAPVTTLGDRVLATLLFSDIVDSTGMALTMGDQAWSDVLAQHQLRTREIVERYRGRVVDFAGDGVLAMFDGAARALRCAVALQAAAGDLDLVIRAAAHTGEVEVAEKSISGVTIHEASRILALAGASETLVSETTALLAQDPGLVLEDRGLHELRGLPGSRRIFALRTEG